MSQEPDKFLYFKVGLLKDSSTLNDLWQDALKHHMVDRPDKLIALRLTEYYEIVSKGLLHPIAQVAQSNPQAQTTYSAPAPTQAGLNGSDRKIVSSPLPNPGPTVTGSQNPVANQSPVANQVQAAAPANNNYQNIEEVSPVAMIPGAEQNAEEAADYWNLL